MAGHSPRRRITDAIMSADVGRYQLDEVRAIGVEPWWPDELAKAERSIRRLRRQIEALLTANPRLCAHCGEPVGGRADRRFCSDKCRIAAHRARRQAEEADAEKTSVTRSRATAGSAPSHTPGTPRKRGRKAPAGNPHPRGDKPSGAGRGLTLEQNIEQGLWCVGKMIPYSDPEYPGQRFWRCSECGQV